MTKNIILIAILAITFFGGCKMLQNFFNKKNSHQEEKQESNNNNIIEIASEDMLEKTINDKKPAIIKFETAWCRACKLIAPVYQKISQQFKDKINFGKVEADKLSEAASKYQIMAVPSFIFFKDGKMIDKIEGDMPEEEFAKKINEFLEK